MAHRLDQFGLGHLAPPTDAHLLGAFVDLVARALGQPAVRIAGPLRPTVRRPPLNPSPTVHRARRNFFSLVLVQPTIAVALFDVLVLALVLGTPGSWHDVPKRK